MTSKYTRRIATLTLEQFKDKNYGKRGTLKREQLEAGFENFKIGAMIHKARMERGITG